MPEPWSASPKKYGGDTQQWQSALEKRGDKGKYWWELRACDYYDAFEKPKIMFPDIAKELRFSLDRTKIYGNNTMYFIPIDDLYLLGLLNSSIITTRSCEPS